MKCPTLVESRTEKGVGVKTHTNLALDLLTSPSSSVASTAAKVLVGTSLPCQGSEEVVTEVFPKVTCRESIRKVTKRR